MRVVCCENPPGYKRPKWQRSAIVADDGTIFGPAAIAGNEMEAFLSASWNGTVPVIRHSDHAFLPIWWLRREYPHAADVCDLIDEKVRAFDPTTRRHRAKLPIGL
jgi:hypothetical protein